MRHKIFLTLVILSFVIIRTTSAQFRMPSFDVEVKANQNLIPGSGDDDGDLMFLETTNIHCGLHIHFGQRLALGAFYSKSFRGIAGISYAHGAADQQRDVQMLIKGVDLRFSGGRAKKWRRYISANFSVIEVVQNNESYRLAGKSPVYGINIGLMRKLSNSLYLNVIELGAKYINDKMFWFDNHGPGSYLMAEAKMGLTYNIGKRK